MSAERHSPLFGALAHRPAFELRPEWEAPPRRVDTVDVNLGHAPEAFVAAAFGQITGRPPPPDVVRSWASRLVEEPHVRRVDVVRALAAGENRDVKLRYSDPWRSQPELVGAPVRGGKRDVGAVFMFFFDCPGGTNCEMSWANTHVPGMDAPHPLFGDEGDGCGIYCAREVGFWKRELVEAKYAGLQFLLLNTYGPDIEGKGLAPLGTALSGLDAPVKVALFDDTWTWGKPYFGDFWKRQPDLADAEAAAQVIYESKWRPFHRQIDPAHWYRFKGRPFIYFYDGGTLAPRERSAAMIARLKSRFRSDFGEEPFVNVDASFFDDPAMPGVADSKFTWMTFGLPDNRSRSRLHGHVIDHAMVRWDSVGRDRPGDLATPRDRIVKDGAVLERVLADSKDADVLVIATWNDLGEGTGIHRNYDYYAGGRWLEPDHFMRLIRRSQAEGGHP
jgi:hypothetical protein